MLELKTKTTSKKFYDKWLYKVSLKINGAGIFRYRSYDDIRENCVDDETFSNNHSYMYRSAQGERETILNIVNFFSSIAEPSLWSKRIERNQLDFYTNDRNLYEDFSNNFLEKIIHRFEPSAGTIDDLDGTQTIVAKKLPHNRYNYKVYLLPHKMKGRKEDKAKFIAWLKAQSPRVTCTEAIVHWFISTEWNWDRRYVLVEDENTLLMLKLRNSDVVGKIYKYKISDK